MALDCDEKTAVDVAAAAEPLWEQLEALGYVDSPGGAEFRRVLPSILLEIRQLSTGHPFENITDQDHGPTTDQT
jgi:hypothetical protein